jgi:hypothetical protein
LAALRAAKSPISGGLGGLGTFAAVPPLYIANFKAAK